MAANATTLRTTGGGGDIAAAIDVTGLEAVCENGPQIARADGVRPSVRAVPEGNIRLAAADPANLV